MAPNVVIDPWVVDRSRDLLERANLLFDNADGIDDAPERFRQYYLAALRASGAVLALYEPRGRPARARVSRSAWNRLSAVAPTLAPAAEGFAVLSGVRMGIESGLIRSVEQARIAWLRGAVIDLLSDAEELIVAYEQGKLAHQTVPAKRSA